MRKYYLLNGKKQSGPFSLDEIKNMEITDKFMVWSEEMTEWKKSTEVDELTDLIIKAPINSPLTPRQEKFELKKKAFYLALRKAFLWLVIITLIVFIIMGGLGTETFLERIYTKSYNNRVFADASEIRWKILPLIVLLFISLPISVLICFFKYKHIVGETDKRKGQIKSSINQSVFIAISLPTLIIIGLLFDQRLDEKEISMVIKFIPYLPLYILILPLVIFHWFYSHYKLKGRSPLDWLILTPDKEEKDENKRD